MKSSRHKKTPTLAGDGVSGNESNYQERNVMTNISTAASNVIPFDFRGHSVRTVMVRGEPWFVAADISSLLEYRDSFNMCRNLDADEKGTHSVSTLGGAQQMLAINESGLYAAILRSKKKEARTFRKWITSEVLPVIRKQGQYVDTSAKMPSLVEGLIGVTELTVIKGLIRQKGSALQAGLQRSIGAKTYSALHTRFNVARTELIPHKEFAEACNFIAAYQVHEGEYLEKEAPRASTRLDIYCPVQALSDRRDGMLTIRDPNNAWLDVAVSDLQYGHDSLCENILFELQRAGYEVEGALFEIRTFRNKMRGIASFVTGLNRVVEDPQRYAVELGVAA